jgi:small subunit ribosomal protein S19e
MATVREAEPGRLITEAARELGKLKEMAPPAWAIVVKTGSGRMRPPEQDDWWFIRSASMLRKLYFTNTLGVSRFRSLYSNRKNRGHKPEHTYPASGAVTRNILKQMGATGLVKVEKGKGRSLTAKGRQFLDGVAKTLQSSPSV